MRASRGCAPAPWRVCKGGTVAPLADHGGGGARQFAEPALIALHSSVWRRVLANHHRLRRLRRVPRQRRAPSPARPRRLSIFSAGGPALGSLPTAAPEPAPPAHGSPWHPPSPRAPPRNAPARPAPRPATQSSGCATRPEPHEHPRLTVARCWGDRGKAEQGRATFASHVRACPSFLSTAHWASSPACCFQTQSWNPSFARLFFFF